MINKLSFVDFYRLNKLKKKKLRDLFDIENDLCYLDQEKNAGMILDLIKENRKELESLNKKKRKNTENGKDNSKVEEEIDRISFLIAKDESIKNNYEELRIAKLDIGKYICLINVWMTRGFR